MLKYDFEFFIQIPYADLIESNQLHKISLTIQRIVTKTIEVGLTNHDIDEMSKSERTEYFLRHVLVNLSSSNTFLQEFNSVDISDELKFKELYILLKKHYFKFLNEI